ncbi:MAG: SRPBCC family protein [Candidatus Hydrogenedentes bacterium]|nr:SRPBCC family protein [Candidatus Hydrogenedentota bacterium]
MLRSLIMVGIVVVVLVVAVVVFAATRPKEFRVERTAQINASTDVVFPLINDFHQWERWSPYYKRDPKMQKTYDGPAAGAGASFSWSGNAMAGAGRTTILDSKAGEFVSMKLEMSKPFACNNHVTFTLAPSGEGTKVSWMMEGKTAFFARALSIVMSMDKMIGADFEDGLANLDAAAQADAKRLKQAGLAAPASA